MSARSRFLSVLPSRTAVTVAAAACVGLAALAACGGDDPTAPPATVPSPGDVTPDLVFSPAALAVAPGDTARTTVRVTTGADLRAAAFAVAGAPAGLATRFVPNEDGTSGTLLLVSDAPLAAGNGGLEVHGVSGAKTWVGRLALTVSASAATIKRSYFVDPAKGKNSNAGSASKPFKTLAKALATAKAGDTVRLAAGTYSPTSNGEQYPQRVPAGLTLLGATKPDGTAATALSPASTQTTGLVFDGDATAADLSLGGFSAAFFAGTGKLALRNVRLTRNLAAFVIGGSATVTMTRAVWSVAGGFVGRVHGRAQLTVDGVQLIDGAGCGTAEGLTSAGITATDSSVVAIKHATFAALPQTLLHLDEDARGTLTDVDVTTPAAACGYPAPVIDATERSTLVATRVRALGKTGVSRTFLRVQDGASLRATRLAVSDYGAVAVDLQTVGATILDSSTFQRNAIAVLSGQTRDAGASLFVTNSVFVDNAKAIRGLTLTLRRSSISGGVRGIDAVSPAFDLGTAFDRGNNSFRGASETEVHFSPGVAGAVLPAVGNVWNANVQGASAAGAYGFGFITSRDATALGPNVRLFEPNGSTSPVSVLMGF